MIEAFRAIVLFAIGFNAHDLVAPTSWGPAVTLVVTGVGFVAGGALLAQRVFSR